MNRYSWLLLIVLSLAIVVQTTVVHAAQRPHALSATPSPTVISFAVIRADAAARVIHSFYPRVRIAVDRDANAIIVNATADEINAIRQIAQGIDTKSPLATVTQSITLHRVQSSEIESRLRALYPAAKFSTLGRGTLLVSGTSSDIQQMQTLIAAIDAPPPTPTPAAAATPPATEAVRIFQAQPSAVAREVAGAVHSLRVQVAGQSVILAGAPDLVQRAKEIIVVLDAPPPGTRYTAVYRIKTLDARSVADLLQRSFPDAKTTVDEDINSLSVLATASEQRRIADGIAQLDAPAPIANGVASANGVGLVGDTGSLQLYTLKYALPGANGAPSTSAADLATTVTQTLGPQASDLHITAAPNGQQLLLTGNPYSVRQAKGLLAQLDAAQHLVALDTEILEVDENTAKNLGIQISNVVGGAFSLGTIFSEVVPTPDPNTGIAPPLKRLRPLTRTPLGFIAVLNLAIEHGSARVLADPRITTLSGHMATIRAGDNIAIQLQAGGGAGTIATTQIQTFQTGVTLDITPIVNDDGLITVALHPVVNSLTGILNGIPQISTRDTQTTVALKENETLVIGGLIQDNTQRTESRIPLLGDLPLVGRAFRNQTLNGNRNELIISVTPHIITPGQPTVYPGPPLPNVPTPQPFPTLPPGARFPTQVAPPTPSPTSGTTLLTPPTAPPIPSGTPTPHGTGSASAAPNRTPATSTISASVATSGVFSYGAPPTVNSAGSADPAQIFYVTFRPTRLKYGEPFILTAITTTNVAQLSLSYNGVSVSVPQNGSGQWQATLPFTLIANPAPTGTVTLSLTASKADGTQTSITIPVTIAPQQ